MNIIEVTYRFAKPLYRRSATDYIIIHHEAGSGQTPQSIHAQHIAQGWAGIGYHYYVRKDGTVYRGRPENTIGTHCPSRNFDSIGVCFEGNFENETMGAAQYNAGVSLLCDILTRYPSAKIGKHKDFYATACPGKNFPFAKMVADTEDENMTGEEIYTKFMEYAATLPESAWSVNGGSVAKAKAAGITDGTKPRAPLTREQAMAILDKIGAIK